MITWGEFNQWLADGKDYDAGLGLMMQFCRNKVLLQNMARTRKPRFIEKMEYEMRKELGKTSYEQRAVSSEQEKTSHEQIAVSSEEEVQVDAPTTSEAKQKWLDKVSTYPEVVRGWIHERGHLHNQREMMFEALKKVPQDNKPENVAKRAAMLVKYREQCEQIEELWLKLRKWEKTGEIDAPAPVIPKTDTPGPEQMMHMIIRRNNLRSSISKYKRKLKDAQGDRRKTIEDMLQRYEGELREIEVGMGNV